MANTTKLLTSDFNDVTDSNGLPVKVTGRKAAIPAMSVLDQLLTTAPGGSTIITITPPVGQIWRIILIGINITAPPLATTGSHTVRLRVGNSTSVTAALIKAVSAFGGLLQIIGNTIVSATTSKMPASEDGQLLAIRSIAISADCPLYFIYNNDTDVAQNYTMEFRLIKEVEYVVS